MDNWPTADGYLDAACVICNGVVVFTGPRETCEAYADSRTDDQEYDYAWRDDNRWTHRRTYINGEAQ